MRGRIAWLVGAALVAAIAGDGLAQTTGGSFGGGDFSSGGSDFSSGGSDYSSSDTDYDYDYEPSGAGSGDDLTPGGKLLMFIVLSVVVCAIGAVVVLGHSSAPERFAARAHTMYLDRLALGIDWNARRALQQELERLATRGDTRTPAGLAVLLQETCIALLRAEESWLYARHERTGSARPRVLASKFRAAAADARSRFEHEVVRAASGWTSTTAAPALHAGADEGEGTVVVTLVLAARRALAKVGHQPDADNIRAFLHAASGLGDSDLMAIEVIWSPAAEDDRMSSAELEVCYPDLVKLDPSSVAGRLRCPHCGGVFAKELLS